MRGTARITRACLVLAALSGLWPGARAGEVSRADDGWDFNLPAADLGALCDQVVAEAHRDFAAIESDTAPATLTSVYGAYDAMNLKLQRISHVWYLKSVHPDTERQAVAEQCIEQITDFRVAVSLSQNFYRRVDAIDLTELNPAEQLMIERRLRDFRQAGVDKDAATRARIRALMGEITALGSSFDKAIRANRRFIDTRPEQLAGLPADFLRARPPNDEGVVRLSTDYPDYFPVMNYSADDDLRRRMFVAAKSIATPQNTATLNALIRKRHELAELLGYSSYATLAMDGLMVDSPFRAEAFLTRVGEAVREPAAREMQRLLQRLRSIVPDASRVEAWQAPYLVNLERREEFAMDALEVRQYFHFERVQSGIFRLTEDLFGVRIVPWLTSTWHADVTAWEIREDGEAIGRFYLDLHPRENKYRHAAHWTLRPGLKDRQLPLSGLAMNFPRGLMEHRQVESFLHEFGHLLHNMFSGNQPWLDIAGMTMERDFVEAPSQMLEEWVWDYDTLKRFAHNDKGESIPQKLVWRMNRARHFGEASRTANQIFYAHMSLNYYHRDPDSFELLPLMKELQAEHSPYPYVPGTHFYNNFGHLNGYSSNYYIYQWSRALSHDLMSPFRAHGLRNAEIAADYRREVLAPGGSKPAEQLVRDFLGRDFSSTAYTTYLSRLN